MLRATLAVSIVLAQASAARADDWQVQRHPFDRTLIARYQAHLARAPHDARVLAQLTALYRRYRTLEALVVEYRALPATWATLVVLGTLERSLGRRDAALARFAAAVAANPDDALAWRSLAELRVVAGQRIAAREAYVQAYAHATRAQEPAALRDLIAFVHASGDHDAEDAYLAQLVELEPRVARTWMERGEALLAMRRYAAARDSFAAAEPLLATDPERRIEVIARGAQALDGLGHHDLARAELERALALAPRGGHLARALAVQLVDNRRAAGKLTEALARLQALWPVGARGAFELATLAELYAEAGGPELAIATWEVALARDPHDKTAQRRIVELLDQVDAGEEALAQLAQFARRDPDDVALQLALARRYGNSERGLATLAALARRHPRDADTLLAIVQLYLAWDRVERAEAIGAQLVGLAGADRDALVAAGARALELGLYRTALAAYRRALVLAPDDPRPWAGVAAALDGLEDWDRALDAAERALVLIPDTVDHRADRRRARAAFVQILARTRKVSPDYVDSYTRAWEWSFEQDGDLASGYLLAAFYLVSPREDQPFRVLSSLHALAPDDPDVVADLAGARTLAIAAGALPAPSPPPDPVGATDPLEDEERWERPSRLTGARFGVRFGAGAGMRGDMPATLAVGSAVALRLAPRWSTELRFDTTRRLGDRGSATAVGGAAGLVAHALTARQAALLVGVAGRGEARFGGELMDAAWQRLDVALDVTTALVLRDAPFVVGLRVEAWRSGPVVGLLELGVEWRADR